uniref:SH2 domain-containing protein n=1 Tax=Plectus sambesii TaxID=2011161 RepID=A0A914X9P4_9BILA
MSHSSTRFVTERVDLPPNHGQQTMDTEHLMEADSNYAWSEVMSPLSPREDLIFAEKHNNFAVIYQQFKLEVETISSGQVPKLQERAFIAQIQRTIEEMYAAAEDEKMYLMNEVLCGWAIKQQKVSIGTLWTQEAVYQELEGIDQQFEYFGELLEQILTGLTYLIEQFSDHRAFEDAHDKFRTLAHYFLYYSVVVARQPPSVVVKCGEAENHRRSRFWFNTEIRMLGGRAFGLQKDSAAKEAQCFLVTDETARQLLQNAYYAILENEDFSLEPQTVKFQSRENGGFKAKFDDMRVSKKGQLRRDSVATRRYCICYSIKLSAAHGLELTGKKVSLPFAVLVGPKFDVEARLFLERSFADLVRQPLSDIPPAASYHEMADALEMKFQAIVETPQKSNDRPALIRPRELTTQAKHHIMARLKPTRTAEVSLDNFMKLPVAEEYANKRTTGEGEWKLIPFYEWFFKLAEIINKHLYSMWFEGLIYGFCGKDEAEMLLKSCPSSALLIRFSDIEYAKIKISVKHRDGSIKHHWYEYQDLTARDIKKELLANPKFQGVDVIYPDIPLEVALGGSKKKKDKLKPRNLQPNTAYFENQGAATSQF